jgi:hypothetical protein
MSMGWMTQVASIPEAPPFTKGFTVFHAALDANAVCGCCFASAISSSSSQLPLLPGFPDEEEEEGEATRGSQ